METTYLNVCDRPISRWSIVRLLKTVLLLLCVSFSSVYVQASDRNEGITISCKNESLEQVIHLIESQSSYLFVLNDKVNTKHKVSIKIENGNINAILNKIFQGTNMTYQVDGDHILISTTHKSIGLDETRQATMIKGKIVDNAGEPMIGVNVLVKGTTNGAITDFEGNYSLADVNENDVLMVTYIGYLTQEIKVGKQSVINVVMKDDTQSLDEVVVVGYGVQKKSDLTGSISSIKPADITSTPTTNALKSLQGKVAGLDITQSSGQPGASISLTMRGNRSLKADNNPLVLVDGIDYGSFVDINPTDIESIEVLKDISSTAIYGTKGANGVIIITTKSGAKGQKTKIDFNAYVSIKNKAKYPRMMNGEEYAQLKREAYRTTNSAAPDQYMDDALIFNAEELEYLEKGYWVDWQDLLLGTGITQNYEISMSGGTEKTSYSLSFGFQDDKGLLKNDVLKRYNGRISLDHKINKIFNVGVNVSYTFKDQDKRQNPLNLANKIPCIGRAYDDNGNFILNPAPGNSSAFSPLCDEQPGAYEDNIRTKRMFASGYLNVNILKDFFFKSTIGIDVTDSREGLDHKINKIFNVGVNVSYTFKDQDKRQNPLNLANKIPCIGRAYDDNGNFILNPAPGNSSAFSPLCDEQPGAYEDNIRTKRMFASGYLNVNILKDFFFKSTIGIDVTDSREGIYKDKNTVANLGVKSTSSVQADNDWRYTWENILNYSKTFGKHGLTAMIGSSTTAYGYEKVLASGANQASALTSFHDLGANADSKENASQLIETQMVSFFGRLNYKFNERYLFQASLRADGSSVLAKGHKWGYFPSASAAWRISEEGFMADQDIFSNLKLRLSWGVAGNSAIDAYATLGGLKKSVYTFGSSVYGYYPSEIANKDLTWEKTSTWNLGLDFSILRNRISGTIDTYISQTSDLLLPSLLPSSTGYASVMQNIGKTENKGIEVTLNTIWFQNKNFSWNTDWTYSLNREKIKALNSGVTRDEGNLWFVGSPTQVFYDYKKIGIWQLGEEVQAKAFGGFKPGDIKVADMSPKGSEGEGVFSTDDRVIFSRVPKYTFGITNNIIYKNFDLMFFIYGRIGQYVKDAYTQLYKPSALENSAPVNYWTPENPSNEYPRPNSGYSTNSYLLQSSLAFRKASFVKIRDITLGYTLPKEWTSKMMVQKLRIYCSLNNFITFTDFPNYDPESNGSMDFPLAKQVLFGINLSL